MLEELFQEINQLVDTGVLVPAAEYAQKSSTLKSRQAVHSAVDRGVLPALMLGDSPFVCTNQRYAGRLRELQEELDTALQEGRLLPAVPYSAIAGITPLSVRQQVRRGKLPGYVVGKRVFVEVV